MMPSCLAWMAFATCLELRQLPGYESVPVLMLTGLDDEASITRAYEVRGH